MRNPAQKVNRRLGVAALELAIGRAHAAHGFDAAGVALGLAGGFFPAQIS